MHRLTGLTWLFLFMVLFLSTATCAAVRNFSSIGVDVSGVSRMAKGLGLGSSERVRDGHDPGEPTPAAAVRAPSAEAGSDAVRAPVSPGEPASTVAAPPTRGPSSAPGAGDRMRIVNTDGLGVVLRTAPRDDARVPRGLSATTRVTVLGREGDHWVHVRGENGLEGWVPTRYLAPAD